MKRKMMAMSWSLAVFALFSPTFVEAYDDLPTYKMTTYEGPNQSGFTNAAVWVNVETSETATEAPCSANDYAILGGGTLRSPEPTESEQEFTFNGHSLHLGSLEANTSQYLLLRNSKYPTSVTFANAGLYLHRGWFGSWNANAADIYGTIHVDATEAWPVTVCVSGGSAGYIAIHGPVLGSGCLWLCSRMTSGSNYQTNFRCLFHENALDGFAGTIDTYWGEKSVLGGVSEDGYTQTFIADTGSFPGHLRMNPGSRYEGMDSSAVFKVANLTLGDKTTLQAVFSADGSEISMLYVTNSLVLSGESYTFAVSNTPSAAFLKSALEASDGTYVYKCATLPVMAVPDASAESFVAACRLDLSSSLVDYQLELGDLDSNGLRTINLVPECGDIVVRRAVDDDFQKNSFTSYGNDESNSAWSDGLSPTNSNIIYLHPYGNMMRTLRTTGPAPHAVETFLGGSFVKGGGAQLTLACGGVKIDDWKIYGDSVLQNIGYAGGGEVLPQTGKNAFVVRGNIDFLSSSPTLNVRPYDGKFFDIQSEISGAGTISIRTCYQDTSTNIGGALISGLNTNFSGKVVVTWSSSGKMDEGVPTRLFVSDPRNLGGACDSWTYNALELQYSSSLNPLASMTLDDETRGVYFNGTPEVFVTNDVTLTINERITWNGVVRKTGEGVLALGGERPFFVSDGRTESVEDKNRLVVCEGGISAVSTNAFRGLEVVMSNGTDIVAYVPTNTTEGVGKYGIVNTDWESSFVIPEGLVDVIVVDPYGEEQPRADYGKPIFVPVCTVSSDVASAIAGKMHGVSPYEGHTTQIVQSTRDDGSVTIYVKIFEGFVIIVR